MNGLVDMGEVRAEVDKEMRRAAAPLTAVAMTDDRVFSVFDADEEEE